VDAGLFNPGGLVLPVFLHLAAGTQRRFVALDVVNVMFLSHWFDETASAMNECTPLGAESSRLFGLNHGVLVIFVDRARFSSFLEAVPFMIFFLHLFRVI
ncbi:hypothetical protein ACJX0J_008875, partial [Zea mays]